MQEISQVDSGIRTDGRVPLGFGDLYASAGDHIGHFNQSSEEEKNVLVSFLKVGIEAGEKCVCLMGAGNKHHELRAALAVAGIEWESHCNCVGDPAAVFLCQYELPMFLGNVVMDAMKTHPICIIGGVIHRNPYYQKPEEYLEELRHRDGTSLA